MNTKMLDSAGVILMDLSQFHGFKNEKGSRNYDYIVHLFPYTGYNGNSEL